MTFTDYLGYYVQKPSI